MKRGKKIVIISLGGSLIVPRQVDIKFLDNFKKTLRKHYKTHKFIIVCGGGTIARKYISVLRAEGKSSRELAMAGIRATRMNARFMMQLFGKEANNELPMDMKEVLRYLKRNNVVFCGALRFAAHSTSDGTAAKLARLVDSDFINMTNIKGLFTANPKTHPKAKFIPRISWKKFDKIANRTKFKAGQHFVLDQGASKIIKKEKIRTYIIGQDLRNLDKIFAEKKFIGTLVAD